MARKAGQGKEEEESRARQQEEKTPACHGRGHHVVEQVMRRAQVAGGRSTPSTTNGAESWGNSFHLKPENA
ncbi:hypothetical protein STEG23_036470 [Scotinomys teguina]